MAAAAPRVDQGPPQRIARSERLAHDEAEPPVAGVAARNLRRESQELLIDEALGVEVAQQSRPSLDEDQLARARPAHLVEDGARRNRARTAPDRADLDRIGRSLLAQALRARGRRNDQRRHLAG